MSTERWTSRRPRGTVCERRFCTPPTLIRHARAGSSSHARNAQPPAQFNNGGEPVLVEQPGESVAVLGVAGHHGPDRSRGRCPPA